MLRRSVSRHAAFTNPADADLSAFLRSVKTVAVVGISTDPHRPSYHVAEYLQSVGRRIIPVRPGGGRILNEPIAVSVTASDVACVFRNPKDLGPVIEELCTLGPHAVRCVWLQEGVVCEAAAARAKEAGFFVVMDRCILKEIERLLGGAKL